MRSLSSSPPVPSRLPSASSLVKAERRTGYNPPCSHRSQSVSPASLAPRPLIASHRVGSSNSPCSPARAVSERRRAEIAEKRARLAQLKAAREEREAASRASTSASLAASGLPTPASSSRPSSVLGGDAAARGSRGSLGASTASRSDEIDLLLRGVGVGRDRSSAGSPAPETPRRGSALAQSTGAASAAASEAGGEADAAAPASPAVELVASEPSWQAPPAADACVWSHTPPSASLPAHS